MTYPCFPFFRPRATAFIYGAALSLALVCTSGFADDIEVFYSQTATDSTDATNTPNVLFVLDNSSSMLNSDGGQEGTRMHRLRLAMDEILTQVENVNIGIVTLSGQEGGGPVRYPITPIDQSVCDDDGCDEVFMSMQIDEADNDVVQSVRLGTLTFDAEELTTGYADGGTGELQIAGLRFEGVGIPQGARISNAVIKLQAQASYPGTGTINVYADDSESAEPFSAVDYDLTDRGESNSTRYDVGPWTAGETYESDDLSRVFQDVVDRSDWCGGNDIALILQASDSRSFLSQEGAAARNGVDSDYNAAILQLTYDVSELAEGEGCVYQTEAYQVEGSRNDLEEAVDTTVTQTTAQTTSFPNEGSTQKLLATRFENIDIEQGAEIAEARIEFTVESSGSGTPSIKVSAVDKANSTQLSRNKRAISRENLTGTSVIWEDSAVALASSKIYTSDISPVVKAIVDRTDWAADNAMTFVFEGTSASGYHTVKLFDSAAKYAPKLYVKKKTYIGQGDAGTADLTARDDLMSLMDGLRTNYYTPMVGAQFEAAQYMIGGPVDYGRTRGVGVRSSNFRVSHPDSYTGGELYTPPGCDEFDPFAAECEDEEIFDAGGVGPQYITPMLDSCQTNHMVLLGDGAAANDESKFKIHELIGDSTCTNTTSGSKNCASALSTYLYNTDLAPNISGTQNIKTHTVAFNLSGRGADFFADVSSKGGGETHSADSADELVTAFSSIIEAALSIDTSFSTLGVTVDQFNRLSHRDDLYYGMFKPSDSPRWDGNLKRYKLGSLDDETTILDYYDTSAVDDNTGYFKDAARSFWEHLDSDGNVTTDADGASVATGGVASRIGSSGIDNRKVYTLVDSDTDIDSGALANLITLADGNYDLHEDNQAITSDKLGISAIEDDDEREAYRQELLMWARGVDRLDQDADGDIEEPRRHMGDPLHANPVIVNYDTIGSEDDRSIIYITTNEGFLHAIDSETGSEIWAFTPQELLENHYIFYDNPLSTTHPYGLDGPLSLFRDEDNDDLVIEAGESVYLYTAMRRGGSNYYAFDITSPESPKLMWVIKGGPDGTPGFEELGQSWSEATKARIQYKGVERDVLMFGAGYDTNQDADPIRDANGNAVTMEQTDDAIGRGIFIVDAMTGERIWMVSGPDTGAGLSADQRFSKMTFGIPGNLRVIDIDSDGFIDQIYASDTGGQVWRFDIVSDGTDDEDILQGGVVADISVSAKEGQRRFYSEPDVAVIEDNGSSYMAISIGSGWRDHPLNDVVQDAYYLIRSDGVLSAPEGYGVVSDTGVWQPMTEDDIYQVNSVATDDVPDYSNGWFLRLPDAGEKVLGSSIIFDNIVYFTTYVPDSEVKDCSPGIGSGFFYALSVFDGSPVVDFDGSGSIETYDSTGSSGDIRYALKHSGIPSSPSILIAADEDPELFVGIEKVPSDITNATIRTYWVDSGTD